MQLFQQLHILVPRFLANVPVGPLEPVAPFQCERAALRVEKPSPHGIFPVRAVDNNLPNIVAILPRSPCSFLGSQSTNRAAEIGTVPGFLGVTFSNEGQ